MIYSTLRWLPRAAAPALLCAGVALIGCQADDAARAPSADAVPAYLVDAGEDGATAVTGLDLDFAGQLETHATTLDYDLAGAERVTVTRPDGSAEDVMLVEGCAEISLEEYAALQQVGELASRQYRTFNLVSSPRTIRVIGYTGGGGYGLNSNMRTALQWAVNNYNRINTGLNFTLSFSASTSADMVVYRQPNQSGAGGQAGFPSGGRPYKWIQIYRGMDNYDRNTIEHVMTHEMGHAVGLRHTDWFSRQSCGQSGESAGSTGAVHIPGTPTGYDANSVMLACFGSGEDGEFGYYDRVALEYLY